MKLSRAAIVVAVSVPPSHIGFDSQYKTAVTAPAARPKDMRAHSYGPPSTGKAEPSSATSIPYGIRKSTSEMASWSGSLGPGTRYWPTRRGRSPRTAPSGGFKDGAFTIAITNQLPVAPVAIHGACRIWPPGRTAIHAGPAREVAGGPLPTGGLTQYDVATLLEQTRDVICSAHRGLAMEEPGTSEEGPPPQAVR